MTPNPIKRCWEDITWWSSDNHVELSLIVVIVIQYQTIHNQNSKISIKLGIKYNLKSLLLSFHS